MKSGTTWLYQELKKHPGVRMPHIKEIAWFISLETRQLPWYKPNAQSWEEYLALFGSTDGFVTGDVTPYYMCEQGAAAEMQARLPNARLLAILRDPVERAFSQYRMGRDNKFIGPEHSFLDVLFSFDAQKHGFRQTASRGHYAEQLNPFLERYQLGENLEVFFYDHLEENPVEFIHAIDRFLGLSEFDSPDVRAFERHANFDSSLQITAEERRVVEEYYAPHDQRLAELLGRTVPWRADRPEA